MRFAALVVLAGCAAAPPRPAGSVGVEAPEIWAGSDGAAAIDVLARTGLGTIRVVIRESFDRHKDVESPLGVWHDDVLDRIDALLARAEAASRTVIVVLHDGRNQRDGYAGDIGSISARAAFRRRIQHVLEYRGPHTGRAWRELPSSLVWWQIRTRGDWRSVTDWTEDMAGYVKMLSPRARVVAEIDHVTFGPLAAELIATTPSVDVWAWPYDPAESLEAAADFLTRKTRPLKKEWMLVDVGALRSRPERVREIVERVAPVAAKHGVRWLFSSLGRDTHEASTDHWPGDVVFDSVICPMARAR